jgi:hypothetical protein
MSKPKRSTIEVQGSAITIVSQGAADFISLTDIARYRSSQEPFSVINNWMRTRSTIEFLGLWEKLCNPSFKPVEFERFKNEAGSNYFVLSPQRWIATTNRRLASLQNQVVMVAPSRTAISHLNSPPGFLQSSSSTSSSNSSASRTTKTTDSSSIGTSSAPSPRSTTASTPTPSRRRSFPPPSPRPSPRSSMPPKPIYSTSPSSAKPRNNGATPIPPPKATSAITPHWSSSSS